MIESNELSEDTSITQLNLKDKKMTNFNYNMKNYVNLTSIDLTNNPFEDFNEVIKTLTTIPNLKHLNISLSNKDQVHHILFSLPKLETLNNKHIHSTFYNIVDIVDEEIIGVSFEKEIKNFNEFYKGVYDKIKRTNLAENYKEDFQALIKEEIRKLNSIPEGFPNYVYSTKVIESELAIYSFLWGKMTSAFELKDQKLGVFTNNLFSRISFLYSLLLKIIYTLHPLIIEKSQKLTSQLDEAIHSVGNVEKEINKYEQKFYNMTKDHEEIIRAQRDQIEILEKKVKVLEEENKKITSNLLSKAYGIITNSNAYEEEKVVEQPAKILREPKGKDSKSIVFKNYKSNINKIFTLRMIKDTVYDIYNSKIEKDKVTEANKLPRETLEQHMYNYFIQKYGLKNLIGEITLNFITGIKLYSKEDGEVYLFGKILRNEIDEEFKEAIQQIRQGTLDYITITLKEKNIKKCVEDTASILKEKINNCLLEEDWKDIIENLYQKDVKPLEETVYNFIKKKNNKINRIKSNQNSNVKMSRDEIIAQMQCKEDMSIRYDELVKVIHLYFVKKREEYLKNFVILFKKNDHDNDGIIDEVEFQKIVHQIIGENTDQCIIELLRKVDPNNHNQICFSDCVICFSESFHNEKSFLDIACYEKSA